MDAQSYDNSIHIWVECCIKKCNIETKRTLPLSPLVQDNDEPKSHRLRTNVRKATDKCTSGIGQVRLWHREVLGDAREHPLRDRDRKRCIVPDAGLRYTLSFAVCERSGDLPTAESLPALGLTLAGFVLGEDLSGFVQYGRVIELDDTPIGPGLNIDPCASTVFEIVTTEVVTYGLYFDTEFVCNTLRCSIGERVFDSS